jgi:acetylornithine deacetylase/succinyl-diaminopimelate desuccinylase-like protein
VNDAEALAWAESELCALVDIASPSGHEHEIATYLEERLPQLGLPVRSVPVPGCGPNLLVAWEPRPRLLLTAHLDTVVPTWASDWHARVDGTVVHGLGTQDDKGCLVAGLLALLMARDEGVALETSSVGLGLCVDEEQGGTGSLAMAGELSPAHVVALEGTELQIATLEAGSVDAWVTVEGRSAHHSFVEEGDNAVERAVHIAAEMTRSPFTRHVHQLGAANCASIAAFSSPSATNVVPDTAGFFVGARFFGPESPDDVVAELTEICDAHGGHLDVVESVGWTEVPHDADLTRAMRSATQKVLGGSTLSYMPAWTDAHNFAEVAGAQAVVFGPGHLRSAHGPDEHVDLVEVVKAARVLAHLVGGDSADADRLTVIQDSPRHAQ